MKVWGSRLSFTGSSTVEHDNCRRRLPKREPHVGNRVP
jgi:hypothetical protein